MHSSWCNRLHRAWEYTATFLQVKFLKFVKICKTAKEDLVLWDSIINSNNLVSVSCCKDILLINYTARLHLSSSQTLKYAAGAAEDLNFFLVRYPIFEVRRFQKPQTLKHMKHIKTYDCHTIFYYFNLMMSLLICLLFCSPIVVFTAYRI